jgi:putative solute:sodium symporter small subunit
MAKSSSSSDRHWERTKLLTVITLIIWCFFSFEIHMWGDALNSFGFPGAYFMAGMGSQVVFAVLIFWFARRQNKIDAEAGVAE